MPEEYGNDPGSQEPAENEETHQPETADSTGEDIVTKYDLGVYAPWFHSDQTTLLKEDLEVDVLSSLVELRRMASRSDIAARRFEVEQAWEAKLFLRGYQHLTARKGGGFELPGEDTRWGPTAQINRTNLLNCNVFSKSHDIIVGAICREVPRVQFLPSNPDFNPEVTAAQTADKYKLVYQRNNKLRELMREIASVFCTDDRAVLLTGYFLDGSNLGFMDEDSEAVSPEDETSPMGEESEAIQNAGTQEDEDAGNIPAEENTAPEIGDGEADQEATNEAFEKVAPKKRRPKGMEKTTLFDKLSAKVPITCKNMTTMPWIQLFEDLDEAVVRAMFPFAKDRIKPEGTDSSELELDRISRMNTNLAIQGKYVTGDSMQRLCTVTYTFLRPSFFYASEVKSAVADKLCELFPDGVLIVTAGSEFMFARNCAMNDHLTIGHAFPGVGQNRRALLTSVMPIQKRLNDWMDLMGDFFVRTVPKRYYDQSAFDIELIQSLDNVPGGAVPFIAKPGTGMSEIMGTDPTVQNQPAMADFIKWFAKDLTDDLSGALQSLYGGATDMNTVGGAEIQRDQALSRLNAAWNTIQEMFADTHRQAVKCAASCRQEDVDDMIPESGRVTFEIAKMKGNVLCYPEYDSSFPESSAQKESRFLELWKAAEANPGGPSALLLKSAKNLKAAKDALRFQILEIPGAAEYEKQQGEFQILVKTGPIPNPEIQQLTEQIADHTGKIQQATEGMKTEINAGTHDPNEIQQAAPVLDHLEQQVQLMQQKLQQLEKDSPLVSTVPPAKDASENHAVEASACYDWMNSPEGRRYKHGTPEEQDVYLNFYLHWKEHSAIDAQLNPKQAQFKSEGLSFSGDISKLPPTVAEQVLNAGGFQTKAEDFQQQSDQAVKNTIKTRATPKILSKLTRS